MSDFQLDLQGYLCPLPLLMCKKALSSLQAGQKLEIFVNDSVSQRDFECLAQRLNLRFHAVTPHHFCFEKGAHNEK